MRRGEELAVSEELSLRLAARVRAMVGELQPESTSHFDGHDAAASCPPLPRVVHLPAMGVAQAWM